MKNIDDLLNENPYLFGAVMILIESAKENQDFKALYKWDSLRGEDFKRTAQKVHYFIDYNEDKVLPSIGEVSLVQEYFDKMVENDTPIECFNTKEDMLSEVIYLAEFARYGAADIKTFTNEELLKKIGKF